MDEELERLSVKDALKMVLDMLDVESAHAIRRNADGDHVWVPNSGGVYQKARAALSPVLRGSGEGSVTAPEPPWPATPRDGNNAKREGWAAFHEGRGRDACPFPPDRADLRRAYIEGWDAALTEPHP